MRRNIATPSPPLHARSVVRRGSAGLVALAVSGIALILIFGTVGPNALLALFAGCIFVAGSWLLWRPGEPPVLLFTFLLPWLQASIAVFHSNWLSLPVTHYAGFPSDIERATVLSLVGLLAMAIGMRTGARRTLPAAAADARQTALAHPPARWFLLYLITWVAGSVAARMLATTPGLLQIGLAAAQFRWVFYFMLAYATFVRGGGTSLLLLGTFVFEFAQGISGYFSDFKTVFIVTMIALMAARTRVPTGTALALSSLAAATLLAGILWTAVKGDYREYVSGGVAAQTLSVGYSDRMRKLSELVQELDSTQLAGATNDFMKRLSYVEFFGAVLLYVPTLEPHQNGALAWDAVTRPFMPRLLFPGKPSIDDTERTNRFTGGLAGTSEATSISIGYVGEMYIDFGPYLMMAGLFALGAAYGWLYRILLTSRFFGGLLGMGVSVMLLNYAGALDNSLTKLAGGVAVGLIVALLIRAHVLPTLWTWLFVRRPTAGRSTNR